MTETANHDDVGFRWTLNFMFNPEDTEFTRATIVGEPVCIPPDLPSQLRQQGVLHRIHEFSEAQRILIRQIAEDSLAVTHQIAAEQQLIDELYANSDFHN